MRQFKRVSTMYLLSKGKSNHNFQMKLSFYNHEKSNLGFKVMRVNTMLRKSPFLQSPFLQPRPTAERLNFFSYRSKIFYTEMVNANILVSNENATPTKMTITFNDITFYF